LLLLQIAVQIGQVSVHVGMNWWRPRELSLAAGSVLRLCAVRFGREMSVDRSSQVVALGSRTDGRFVFRVTTGVPGGKPSKMWLLDAGSAEELAAWVALVQDTIHQAGADGEPAEIENNAGDRFDFYSRDIGPYTAEPLPAFRGNKLSSEHFPLRPGQFLSTLPLAESANLEVTEIGDVILRRGDLPAYPTDASTLWEHRATGSICGKANGGLLCLVELWWEKLANGKSDDTPVHLAVKDGRWRVGRGRLCTMGQSPKPKGGWRVHLPWDERGKVIKAASLQILDDKTLVLTSGGEVFWSSSPQR
ncbi:unnamed protein product, partial [Pylaiella littoralis]